MDYLEALETLNKILAILGDVTLGEAKTWVETKANAEALRQEGHETDEAA